MASRNALQHEEEVFSRLAAAGRTQRELAAAIGIEENKVSKIKKGERRLTAPEMLAARDWLDGLERADAPAACTEGAAPDEHDTVGIQHIDLAYGLGATFTDSPVDVEVLQFPKQWVETITYSPPALLTWTRGRGDSMVPTIHDGDLLLLDRSQKRVAEQDALWAYTVGDIGAVKRLRIKGDRVQILSDNPSVPPDEEPIDTVNIVARVVFIGKRS